MNTDIDKFTSNTKLEISNGIPYAGMFNIPRDSDMYKHIVRTEVTEDILKTLNTQRGLKLQRAVFNRLYVKPVKRYCKSRSELNTPMIVDMLIKENILGKFSTLAYHLDSSSYSLINILKSIRLIH